MSTVQEGPVKLWTNKKEREEYDSFADLFAIIKTMEKLEKAYVRDAVKPDEYEKECLNLITKFKTLSGSLRSTVPDVEHFMRTYRMDCPAAVHRLLRAGVPATIEHGRPRVDDGSGGAVSVAETVQHFITTMDALKLDLRAVDQIFPYLSELVQSLHKVPQLPPDFEGKEKMKEWITRLNRLRASDELAEDQIRQLLFDLESTYQTFMRAINPGAANRGANS